MEILLLITLIAVAASALFVAFTSRSRSERNIAPFADRVANELETTRSELKQQVKKIADQLEQDRELPKKHSSTGWRENQAESSPDLDSLVLAMLEAESLAEIKGWGKPPQLYALTNEMQDGHSGALMPAGREPLPDGNLIEGLASISWPEDVAGCVLVAELSDLPLRGAEAAFAWAPAHSTGTASLPNWFARSGRCSQPTTRGRPTGC